MEPLEALRQEYPALRLSPARLEGRFVRDSLGGRTRIAFLRPAGQAIPLAEREDFLNLFQPAATSDYLDWRTVLEAARSGRGEFRMIELGAGWGRWSVLSALAAQVFGRPVGRLTAYEAEPTHFAWTRRHFADNGLAPRRHRLVRAAVGAADGAGTFYVGNPRAWYGQALLPAGKSTPWPQRLWHRLRGHQALAPVAVTSLRTILAEYESVDLVHMDIQGAERDVVAAAIESLDDKVARVHIATHPPDTAGTGGTEVEEPLRLLFSSHGWELQVNVPNRSEAEICGRRVPVNDGVQVWTNPRLAA